MRLSGKNKILSSTPTSLGDGIDMDSKAGVGEDNWIVRRPAHRQRLWPLVFIGILAILTLGTHIHLTDGRSEHIVKVPKDAEAIKARCKNLQLSPGPSAGFSSRSSSDRFVLGTKPVLIKNATIWTGNDAGREIVKGDVVIDQGLIKIIAVDIDPKQMNMDKLSLEVIDAEGGWVTPGYAYLNRLGVLATSAYSSLVSSICIHIWASIPFQSFPEQATAIHAKELFSRGCVPLMVLIPMMKHTNSQSLAD